MAKAGKIDEITTKDASFEGSGVEGQKGAEEPAPQFDENTSYVVTHRDGLLKKIYFRDGKEVGSENV